MTPARITDFTVRDVDGRVADGLRQRHDAGLRTPNLTTGLAGPATYDLGSLCESLGTVAVPTLPANGRTGPMRTLFRGLLEGPDCVIFFTLPRLLHGLRFISDSFTAV